MCRRLKGYGDYNSHTGRFRARQHAESARCGNPSVIVYQYNLSGQYIAKYESIHEAARALGHDNPSPIHAVLRHTCQTAYGYQWSREKVDSMPIVPVPQGKLVRCINTNQIFPSVGEAAKWCNLKSRSGINSCCRGKRKTAGKHPQTEEPLKWEYIE